MKKYVWFACLVLATACAIEILSEMTGLVLPGMVSLLILVAALLGDMLTTYLCLRVGGREGNPVIAWLFKHLTVLGTFGLAAIVEGLFIYFRILHASDYSKMAVALTYLLVPANNLIVMRRLINRNRAQKAKANAESNGTDNTATVQG